MYRQTIAACQGISISGIAGHVSRDMLEHYSHIRMEAKRDAVSALDRAAKAKQVEKVAAPAKEVII